MEAIASRLEAIATRNKKLLVAQRALLVFRWPKKVADGLALSAAVLGWPTR